MQSCLEGKSGNLALTLYALVGLLPNSLVPIRRGEFWRILNHFPKESFGKGPKIHQNPPSYMYRIFPVQRGLLRKIEIFSEFIFRYIYEGGTFVGEGGVTVVS